MSAGKVFLHLIGAAGLLVVTYLFYWAIEWVNANLLSLSIVTYQQTVWVMSGVLAFLIVLSAIAKDHARLEMLSSASFLVYVVVAYTIGCSILTVFMPYNGFGQLNVQLVTDIGAILPIGISDISAVILYTNTVAAWFIVILQALRFIKTFFKSMTEFREVPSR
ncbi:MAG: hypothetical protein GYA24_15365 [Candidatus Lokiarchaeota archaeon]|nr:hypothetical protein [Candidatus Lokiarchaeota archaeon]